MIRNGLLALAAALALLLAVRPMLVALRDLPRQPGLPLRQVAEDASVTGHVRGEPFVLRRGVFEYLLDHPEFATQLTQALDVGPYRVWREPEGLWLDDGRGAVGRVWVVHAADGTRVAYLDGHYKASFLPAIHGRAVVVLEYETQPAGKDRARITPALTGFVKIDNAVVELASKVLSAVAEAKAEKLARRVVGDFAETARAIEDDPARVYDALRQRPDVAPAELDEFRRLLSLP